MEREYKDSGTKGIGFIPQSWDNSQLGIFFSENRKANSSLESFTALQFKYGEIIQKPNNGRELSDKDKELLSKYTVIEPGDVIVNGLNLNFDLKSLRIAIARENGIITSAYIVLRPRRGVNPEYYNYVLKALDFQKILHGMGEGIRLTLSYDELKKMNVPAPDSTIQSGIVSYLDKKCGEIDSLISLQEQMIEKLKAYKQSVITEAVTKGLKPNAILVPSGIDWIGEIPEGWSKDKVIRSFKKIGSGTTPKSTDDTLFEGNINWLQSGDINGSDLFEASKHISEQTLASYSALCIYQAPFIIIAMYGASVGNISISHIDACVNQACCVLSLSNLNFKYAFYALKSAKPYLIYRAEGGGQPNISQDKLKSLWIPRPPMDEQQEIASYLDSKCSDIDRLIALKQQKIESLKDYKKSVIYEAVTGKTIIE
jgi:type I restriction enzyme S subunit